MAKVEQRFLSGVAEVARGETFDLVCSMEIPETWGI